ncbi:cytochrome P450 [Streptomyces sp. NPDC002466]|uniref:cytochrome P450 family protein n=1 Tax=unclassified Streptomyces TaxID=2593676 RepID=UPI003318CEDC
MSETNPATNPGPAPEPPVAGRRAPHPDMPTDMPDEQSLVYGEAMLADPHAVFARMREESPLHQDVIQGGGKVYVPTRYEDVRALLAEPRLLRSFAVEDPDAFQGHIGNSDPPRHTRLRKLTGKALTPKRVERLRPAVERLADELLDGLAGREQADLVQEFTHPLAELAGAELLGIDPEDAEEFRTYWDDMAAFPDSTGFPEFQAATESLGKLFARIVEARRATPTDDLVSALVHARVGEDRLSDAELVQTGIFLVIASNKTVSAMLGNAVLALLDHPTQLELLRSRPDLLRGAIEECLRYEAPVSLTNPLRAGEAVCTRGLDLAPGDLVQPALTAANRDPRRFPDPERLDIARPVGGHVSFGHGIHMCLGAQLSRMTGEVALGRLVRRFPELRLAHGDHDRDVRWSREHIMRRLTSLHVGLGAPAPAGGTTPTETSDGS